MRTVLLLLVVCTAAGFHAVWAGPAVVVVPAPTEAVCSADAARYAWRGGAAADAWYNRPIRDYRDPAPRRRSWNGWTVAVYPLIVVARGHGHHGWGAGAGHPTGGWQRSRRWPPSVGRRRWFPAAAVGAYAPWGGGACSGRWAEPWWPRGGSTAAGRHRGPGGLGWW